MRIAIVLPYTKEELEKDINLFEKERLKDLLDNYDYVYPGVAKDYHDVDDTDLSNGMPDLAFSEADIQVVYFDVKGNFGRGVFFARLLSLIDFDEVLYVREDNNRVFIKGKED